MTQPAAPMQPQSALAEPPSRHLDSPGEEEEYGTAAQIPAPRVMLPVPEAASLPPRNGAPPRTPPELSDLERMVAWVKGQIRDGYHNAGKLNLAAVVAARDAVLNGLAEKHRRIKIVTTWDGEGLPDQEDEAVQRALVLAGVQASDLDLAFAVYERCALRFTVVLGLPELKVAISFLEKRARHEQAEQLAKLPAHKLTEEQRRTLYPNDATDDGDSEILACVVHPTEEAAEKILEKFGALSIPLRQQMIDLCYADVAALQKPRRDVQKELIAKTLTPEQIATYGGMGQLVAFEAREVGLLIMRRPGRLMVKKSEQSSAIDGSMATHKLGLQVVVHPPDMAAQLLLYPCLGFAAGFHAMQLAAGQVDIEVKK